MADARNTLEAVFAETTKDISALIGKVEDVEKQVAGLLATLPAAADELNARLEPTLTRMYAATGKLHAVSHDLIAQHSAALEGVAKASSDALDAHARKLTTQLHEQMGESARLALASALKGDVVKKPVDEAVKKVADAVSELSQKTANIRVAQERVLSDTVRLRDELASAIEGAQQRVERAPQRRFWLNVGALVVLGIVLISAARWAGFGGLSDAQFAQLRSDVKASSLHDK